MIGNDRFVQVFGSVPAGDDTLLVQIVANAVREGFHIVLCEPGTDIMVCTLPLTHQKREHECGTGHVLSLESLLGPTTAKELNDVTGVWEPYYEPKEKVKVRPKVQAIINRVTKQYGAKPNIGVLPWPSGYVTQAHVRGFWHPAECTTADSMWDWCWYRLPEQMRTDDHVSPVLVPPSTTKFGPLRIVGQTNPAPKWLLERITQ